MIKMMADCSNSNSSGDDSMQKSKNVCWFCKKGRHSECMIEIPTTDKSDGPHDCTFGTTMVRCACVHCGR